MRHNTSLLAAFCLCNVLLVAGSVIPCQASARSRKVKQRRPALEQKIIRTDMPAKLSKGASVVGTDLNALALGGGGDIFAGGSVRLSQSFLLRGNDTQISVTRLPHVKSISDIIFTPSGIGWMVADGQLFSTRTNGETWERKRFGDSPEFRSIFFSSDQSGWAAGWGGAIYNTDDGGTTWHRQDSSTSIDLWKILFVDDYHGWATGGQTVNSSWHSILLATDDGGHTWRQMANQFTFHDITFADQSHGWGLDLSSQQRQKILYTSDGGETWTPQYAEREGGLESLFFLNSLEGWAVGDKVLHTLDAGQTWNVETAEGFGYTLKRAVFISNLEGWAIGLTREAVPNLLHTTDGGENWLELSSSWKSKIGYQ